MKRRLALLVCIIATLAMVFALASCGGDECEHTYSTEYTTDANGHWYVATCGCEGEVSNYGAHVDSNNDGKCDTCKYVLCAHTYETEWSTDENNHWNASNCDCTPTKANEAKHVDENKDGICDVCKYVMCEHTYSDWKTDETKHWKEATCGCTVANTEEGAHVDGNKDGNCDTCAYVMCEHTYATEWSTDGAYHWYEATCGCNVVGSKAEHTNEDGDKLCDVCEANICEHTYEETLSSDETHHWYAATCGCDVKKEYAEHTWEIVAEELQHYTGTTCGCNYKKDVAEHADEDEDDKCDTCESDMTLFNVIAGLDQSASENLNSSTVDYDKTVFSEYSDYVTDTVVSVKYYDNYAVYTTVDGETYYCSYYGENNDILFVYMIDAYNVTSRSEYVSYPTGTTISYYTVYGNVSASNHEELVADLYNLGAAKEQEYGYSYCFTKSYNEETGVYAFSYVYCEGNAYVVEVEFTLTEAGDAIATATVEINSYDQQYVDIGETTYTVAEGAAKTQEEKYVIAQTFGDPFDSTDAPNPHPASKYIVTDSYKLHTKDGEGNVVTEYENDATVELDANDTIVLYFSEALDDVIKFNTIELALYDSEENQISEWDYSTATFAVDTYDNFRPIRFKGLKADTYKLVVDVEGVEYSINFKVNYLTPETISPVVIKGEDKLEVTEYTMYTGQTLIVSSMVEEGCDPAYIATLSAGAAAAITANDDGTYTVTPVGTGTFNVVITSAKDANVTATLAVTVAEPPTPAEILNGKYQYIGMYDNTTINAEFTPASEGATNGTLIFSYNKAGNPMWGEEDVVIETTFTYAFSPAGIALTYVSGDETTAFTFSINDDFAVAVSYDMYGIGYMVDFVLEKAEATDPSDKEPTTDFTFTITDAATYDYSSTPFTFVAGEAGTYTFTVPATVGVITKDAFVNYGSELVSFNNNDSGATFTLDLEAGEAIDLYVTSTVAGTYTITFTTGEAANNVVTYTGTNADVTLSTITVIIDESNETVTYKYVHPMTGMETSMVYDYVIEDGLMTLYFQGEAVAEDQAYVTLVDGVATVAGLNGNAYTLVAEGDDEETEGIAGTYSVYNEMFPETTMTVVITDETITFTPPGPGAMEVSYTYTYENNIVTLYDADGNAITSPLAGYLTVVDGEPTELGYNGSTYLFGEPEAEETNELVLGENEVDVVVEGGFPMATTVTFTATEAGTYTISPADGETNADVTVVDGDWIEEFPYTFTLEAGQSISFDVCSADVMSTTTDTINLVIAKAE